MARDPFASSTAYDAPLLRGSLVIGFVALCILLAGRALDAVARQLVIPIAGLTGGHIQVAGAVRTNGGGAILASRITGARDSSRGRIVVARLLADGALDLAYGTQGLSTLRVDSRLRPVAVTIDPATGETWIGARIGKTGRPEIIALKGNGERRRGFANSGVLRLPTRDDGGPVALAWRPGALLIAAGEAPCRGCSLSVRNPDTGRLITSFTLPVTDLTLGGCGAGITSAVFANVRTEFVATRAAPGSGCGSSVLALGPDLQPIGPSGPPPPPLTDALASASLVAGSGAEVCIAATDPTHVSLTSYAASSAATSTQAPAGTLVALVPLGPGSCAALIRTSRARATVAQMSSGDIRALTNRLPGAITPLALFRCHQHLLVVAATKNARGQAAVILAVPVRRGKFAARAFITSAPPSSTGCS